MAFAIHPEVEDMQIEVAEAQNVQAVHFEMVSPSGSNLDAELALVDAVARVPRTDYVPKHSETQRIME